jgi:hypothetical protein
MQNDMKKSSEGWKKWMAKLSSSTGTMEEKMSEIDDMAEDIRRKEKKAEKQAGALKKSEAHLSSLRPEEELRDDLEQLQPQVKVLTEKTRSVQSQQQQAKIRYDACNSDLTAAKRRLERMRHQKEEKLQVGARERRGIGGRGGGAVQPICGGSGQNLGLSGGDPPNPPCCRRGRACARSHMPPNPPCGRRAKQAAGLRESERDDAAAAAASGAARSRPCRRLDPGRHRDAALHGSLAARCPRCSLPSLPASFPPRPPVPTIAARFSLLAARFLSLASLRSHSPRFTLTSLSLASLRSRSPRFARLVRARLASLTLTLASRSLRSHSRSPRLASLTLTLASLALASQKIYKTDNYKGQQIKTAVDWIKKNADKFRRPVLGPIAAEVTCKDESIANYLDMHCANNVLLAFVTEDKRDTDLIWREVREKLKCNINIETVDTSSPETPKRNYGERRFEQMKRDYGIQGYLDQLIDCPPIIKKALYSQSQVRLARLLTREKLTTAARQRPPSLPFPTSRL